MEKAPPRIPAGEPLGAGREKRPVDYFGDHEYIATHSWRKHPRGLRLESRLVRDGRKGRTVYAHAVNTVVQALSAVGKAAAGALLAVRREKHFKNHPEA